MKTTILNAIAATGLLAIALFTARHVHTLETALEASIDRERELWYQLHPLDGPTPADEKVAVLLAGIMTYQVWPDATPEERMQVHAIMGNDGEN